MVKLEDMKVGDVLYGVSKGSLALYVDSVVKHELCNVQIPEPTEAVICSSGIEILTRSCESMMFKTKEEAMKELERLKSEYIQESIINGKFKERLMDCSTTSKRLDKWSERDLYSQGLDLLIENYIRNN